MPGSGKAGYIWHHTGLFSQYISNFIHLVAMQHERRRDPTATRTLITRPIVGTQLALTLWTVNSALQFVNQSLLPLHRLNEIRWTCVVLDSQGRQQRIQRSIDLVQWCIDFWVAGKCGIGGDVDVWITLVVWKGNLALSWFVVHDMLWSNQHTSALSASQRFELFAVTCWC